MKFIYKISWFETKRHTKSHTNMYFENPEHTKWVFETNDWFNDLVKVEYIMVGEDTMFYKCAVESSNLHSNLG